MAVEHFQGADYVTNITSVSALVMPEKVPFPVVQSEGVGSVGPLSRVVMPAAYSIEKGSVSPGLCKRGQKLQQEEPWLWTL